MDNFLKGVYVKKSCTELPYMVGRVVYAIRNSQHAGIKFCHVSEQRV